MRKNCGKQLVKKSATITSKCFDNAVDDVMSELNIDDTYYPKDDLIRQMRVPKTMRVVLQTVHPEIDNIKELVDLKYLERLCSLSTKDIEDIVWIHDCGKLKRASRTIETLTSELIRRALMNDSSESESKTTSKGSIYKTKVKNKQLRRSK